jgi:hypothetical protein
MTEHPIVSPTMAWRLSTISAAVLYLTACSTSTSATPTSTDESPPRQSAEPAQSTAAGARDPFADVPDEARVATRRGDPRTAGYWALWNGCAPDNRAAAAANGGREAGWILMDDLLADPGIQLGDHPVTSCEGGLALLEATAAAEEGGDAIDGLAAALLTAELNLNAGAKTCPAAEEAVLGGHLILANAGFDGVGHTGESPSDEVAAAVPCTVALLRAYNRGELCR